MVNRVLVAAFLSVITGCSFAGDPCTKGSEYEPSLCPLQLPKINKVTIVENAAKSPAEKDIAVTCASFSVNEEQVRRYFSMAKVTDESDAHHTLDWSPCYASGKILFSDGSTGDWNLSQFRAGSLVVSAGKKMFLYCPQCKFKPFQWQ